jgi:hypothetical protein
MNSPMMSFLATATHTVADQHSDGGFVLFGFLALILGSRLLADRMDRWRINDYVKSAGASVVAIVWEPFGTGWPGSKRERIYSVTYRTAKGSLVTATCKTSLLSGVYWTDGPAPFREPED